MPNEQPSEYEMLMAKLRQKAQNVADAGKQAWGGRSQEEQAHEQQNAPAYMQAGHQPGYKQDANTVMTTGGFSHPQEAPPPPPPEAAPAPQNAPPPYMAPPPRIQPVRMNQNNANAFMQGNFKK